MYFDPNTHYKTNITVGQSLDCSINRNEINITGSIDKINIKKFSLEYVVALDGAGRYIHFSKIINGKWEIKILSDITAKDNKALEIGIFATSNIHNFMYIIYISEEILSSYEQFVKKYLPIDSQDLPSLSSQLHDLIDKTLSIPYFTRSIHQGITTGKNYQTLYLGEGHIRKGRNDRMDHLKKIDFKGKSVLDLGANMGQISRTARMFGANIVDGIEYDPSFVEIGRATNALVGMTRVSLFQGDITNPYLYEELHYDIILALSVWVYLTENIKFLPRVAPLMIFETHTLGHGMEYYYSLILPHYPYCQCFGLVDLEINPLQTRAMIAFASNQQLLNNTIKQSYILIKPYYDNVFLENISTLNKDKVYNLAEIYFKKLSIESNELDENMRFGTIGYFQNLLAGFYQFIKDGHIVTENNLHLVNFINGINRNVLDKNLKPFIKNKEWAKRKVANKFEDMNNIINGHPEKIPPIILSKNSNGPYSFFTTDDKEIKADNIDGHHRYFMCQLMGIDKIHYICI